MVERGTCERWIYHMRITLLAFFLTYGILYANEDVLVSGGESPDKTFRVVLITPDSQEDVQFWQPSASFRHVQSGRIVGTYFVGGYANFEGAKDSYNTEVLWNPDSRYAAIRSRTSKRTGGVEIFHVSPKSIQKIKTSDYVHRILRLIGADEIDRYCYEKPTLWLSTSILVIDVIGDCIIGPSDSRTWLSFHYEVSVDVTTGKIKRIKKLELKDEIG